jgi:hypothetical protein
LIDGSDPQTAKIEASLAPLRRGVEWVQQGTIIRRQLGSRWTHYIVPQVAAGPDNDRASYVPEFNEAVSDNAVFWPQVRARWDAERICLVSTERPTGWFHDLWSPGYLWADTEGLWHVPGLTFHDGMSTYTLDNPRLIAVFVDLQRQETGHGQWGLGGTKPPFGDELQKRFPLVGRFLDDQSRPAVSQLPPERVASAVVGIFD